MTAPITGLSSESAGREGFSGAATPPQKASAYNTASSREHSARRVEGQRAAAGGLPLFAARRLQRCRAPIGRRPNADAHRAGAPIPRRPPADRRVLHKPAIAQRKVSIEV